MSREWEVYNSTKKKTLTTLLLLQNVVKTNIFQYVGVPELNLKGCGGIEYFSRKAVLVRNVFEIFSSLNLFQAI